MEILCQRKAGKATVSKIWIVLRHCQGVVILETHGKQGFIPLLRCAPLPSLSLDFLEPGATPIEIKPPETR